MAKRGRIITGFSLAFALVMGGTAGYQFKENQDKDKILDAWENNAAAICNGDNLGSLFNGRFCDNARLLKIVNDKDLEALKEFKTEMVSQGQASQEIDNLVTQFESLYGEFINSIGSSLEEVEKTVRETTDSYKTKPNVRN